MKLTLKVWRQKNNADKGGFVSYPIGGISKDMSFLEMMDVLNEQLTEKGEDPVHLITIVEKESAVCVPCI